MKMEHGSRRWFQFSLNSCLIVTAVAALLLAPLAWVIGERREMMRAYAFAVAAQEEALRERVDAERSMQQGEAQLRQENALLKKQVEWLHNELEILKATQGR